MNEELKNILYKIGMVGRIIGVGGIIIERLGLYPSREYEMEGKILNKIVHTYRNFNPLEAGQTSISHYLLEKVE